MELIAQHKTKHEPKSTRHFRFEARGNQLLSYRPLALTFGGGAVIEVVVATSCSQVVSSSVNRLAINLRVASQPSSRPGGDIVTRRLA